MALNKSTLLIRDFENIRAILRDIYIFGCFSREDFIEKQGISGRKYDKEQQRISAYLPKKFIQKRRVDKKVLLYCSYNSMDSRHNYLADTYRNKTFTALDVMAFFFVQQLLSVTDEMTASQILDALPLVNESVVFTKDNLRIKLEELVEKGFITVSKRGRTVFYRLSDDIWSVFEDDELIDICTYLQFMKNISPIEMPYYFVYNKLALYLQVERKLNIAEYEVFSFKHNHLFNALDNDILLDILRAKKQCILLTVALYTKQNDIRVIPGEVIHDSVYGRQYMSCYDIDSEKETIIRIDKIKRVFCGRKMNASEKRRAAEMSSCSSKSWCTSKTEQGPEEIVIRFIFNEEKEPFILWRIINEGHGGTISKIDKDIYEFRLLVEDPDEMLPWIRSFGERAKVISSGSRKTEKKIAEDWKKALKKYESI